VRAEHPVIAHAHSFHYRRSALKNAEFLAP
jgi:hypothetical protein